MSAVLTRKVWIVLKKKKKGQAVGKVASKELRWRGAWNRVGTEFSGSSIFFFFLNGKGGGPHVGDKDIL